MQYWTNSPSFIPRVYRNTYKALEEAWKKDECNVEFLHGIKGLSIHYGRYLYQQRGFMIYATKLRVSLINIDYESITFKNQNEIVEWLDLQFINKDFKEWIFKNIIKEINEIKSHPHFHETDERILNNFKNLLKTRNRLDKESFDDYNEFSFFDSFQVHQSKNRLKL